MNLLKKYPDCVPIIFKKRAGDKILQDLDKPRYLIPKNLKLSEVIVILRKKIVLTSTQALFVFVNGCLVPMNETMGDLYNIHKSADDMMYLYYTTENTFG